MFYTYALPIKVTSGFEKEVWNVVVITLHGMAGKSRDDSQRLQCDTTGIRSIGFSAVKSWKNIWSLESELRKTGNPSFDTCVCVCVSKAVLKEVVLEFK